MGSRSDNAPDGDDETDGAEPAGEPAPTDPAKARRRPLPEVFNEAARELTRAADRLARLCDDDRFTRNRDQTHQQVPELLTALERTIQLFQAMDLPSATTGEDARHWWAKSLHTISNTLATIANTLATEHK